MATNPFDAFDTPSKKGRNPFDAFDEGGGIGAPATPGFVRQQADRALALGQGITGGLKSLVDVAGTGTMASKALGAASEGMESLYSPARVAEKQARAQTIREADESGSTARQITARLGGFTEAPAQTLLQGIGSMAPTLGAAVATRGRSVAASHAVGAAQGIGEVKGGNYDAVKSEALNRGLDDATAERLASKASEYSAENLPQQALGAVLGAVAGGAGAERIASRIAGGQAAKAGFTKRVATGAATEAVPEGAQGAQGQFAQNEALDRAGFKTDPWTGVLGTGLHDAAVGAVIGAGFGVPRGSRAADGTERPHTETIGADSETTSPQPETNQPTPEVPAAAPATPDQVRAQKLPDTGPLSAAVNAGIEAEARVIEAAARRGELLPPPMEVSEISLADAGRMLVPGELAQDIPAGEATEVPVETVDTGGLEIAPPPRAQRQRSGEPVEIPAMEIDRAGRMAVAKYLSEMRRTNTPAARAFMQDFEAGRITRADVLRLVRPLTPAAEPTPDQRLAAAAAQAPQQQGTDSLLLTGDGFPYGTPAAAVQRASREKLDAGSVIEVAGGYAVRPRDLGAGLEPKGPPDPKATRTPPSASSAPIAPATSPAAEPTTTVVPQVARSTGQTEAVTTSAAAPDSTQAPAPAAGVTVAAAPDTTVPRPERLRNGFIRYRFTTAEDMDGQVSIAPPGWRKGSKSFVVSLDRTGGPKDERGQTKFYRTEDLGKYRTEEAARAAAEGFVRQYRKSAPAAAPTESAAQPTQGETDGQEQGLQGRRTEEVAPRRAPVTPQVASQQQIDSFIGIAADSVQRLRSQDVDRVISETPAHFRLSVAEHIKTKRADLAETVDEALAENPEQRPAPPVAESQAPARSADGDAGIAPGQESGAPAPTQRDIARLRKLLGSLNALRDCVAA